VRRTGPLLLCISLLLIRELGHDKLRHDLVELVEPRVPAPLIDVDPRRHLVEAAAADPAGAHTADLAGLDQAGRLEDGDVLAHPRQGHAEPDRELGDGALGAPELLEHAASRAVGQGRERVVELRRRILNHVVQYC
jgi:hypothetical protein